MLKVTLRTHKFDTAPFTQLPGTYERVAIANPSHDTDVLDGEAAPRIFVNLDADVMESHSSQTVCTAVVKCGGDRTAVVHFTVRVRDGKVTAEIAAGGRKRDVKRIVNVPVWKREHCAGK